MTSSVGGSSNTETHFSQFTNDSPEPLKVNLFHRYSDVDGEVTSHHHTLGRSPSQSAPGNHTHDGVDSASVVVGADLAVEPWTTVGSGSPAPAFTNGWVEYDNTIDGPVKYTRLGPLVIIKGVVKGGVIGSTTPIFTLPVGFRPDIYMIFVATTNTGFGEFRIHPTGEVTAWSGGNGYFALNCSFIADQ